MNSQLVINKHIHMQVVIVRIYFQLLSSTIEQYYDLKLNPFVSFVWQLLYYSDHCWFFKMKAQKYAHNIHFVQLFWQLQDLRQIKCAAHKMPVSFFSTTSVQKHFLSIECVAR
jgi:hypothetical protein